MEIAFTALFILLSFYHGTISFGLLNHRQGENIAALLLEYSNLSNECNDVLSVLPYAMTDSNSNDFVDICFNACLANKHCKSFTVTSTNNECFLRNCAPSQIDRQHGDEPHNDRDVRVIYYDIENKESEIRRLGSDGRSQQISMTNMPTPYQQESEIVMDSNETIIDVTEKKPTSAPSLVPTFVPTGNPTPSASPTHVPTTRFPTLYPTNDPLIRPTKTPTTRRPTTTRAPTWPDETMTPTSFPVNIRQTPYPTIKRTDGFVSPSNIPYSYSVHWEYYGGKKRPIPTNKKVCEVVMVSPGSSYRKYDNWKGNLDDCVKECTVSFERYILLMPHISSASLITWIARIIHTYIYIYIFVCLINCPIISFGRSTQNKNMKIV